MYAAGTVIFYGPAVHRLLHRRSDGRIRPAVIAAGGVASAAVTFLILRALRHRRPGHGLAPTDFLPPRYAPEATPPVTPAAYELAAGAEAPLP
ncbi:hypothetical protein [Streptomyces rubellomurinus]|uniref:Uncharacterized protein n=2 Tax=Streptomyces TaxID=1883 RepID=A0A0F2TFA9_STRR3|nr:hypothetical protein [Streptomyces rubellomurinus]KJS61903.1 hypothetical protein VM95_12115 [Streptomyces rubellomurinus]